MVNRGDFFQLHSNRQTREWFFFVFRMYIIVYHFFRGIILKLSYKQEIQGGNAMVNRCRLAARVPFRFVRGSFSRKERLEIIVIPRAFLQNNGHMGRLSSALPKKTDA